MKNRKLIICAVACMLLVLETALASSPSFATTKTISSGNDPSLQFAAGPAGLCTTAVPGPNTTWQSGGNIISDPNYDVIPGTSWVSSGSPQNATITYRISFDLPNGGANTSVTVQVFADNVAAVFLNGTLINSPQNPQRCAEIGDNFKNPPLTLTTTGPFNNGQNFIEFNIYNFGGPSGLDYKVVITTGACKVTGFLPHLGQCRLFNGTNNIPGWASGTSAYDQYSFHQPYNNPPLNQPRVDDGNVCRWGCALTAFSMALNHAGVPNLPYCSGITGCLPDQLVPNDPGSLNQYFKFSPNASNPTGSGLYTPANDVDWAPATQIIATAIGPAKLRFDFSMNGITGTIQNDQASPSCSGSACKVLDDYLCSANLPVIVKVLGNDGRLGDHTVLVIGQGEDTHTGDYLIFDPANDNGTPNPRHDYLGKYSYVNNPNTGSQSTDAPFSIVGVVRDPIGDMSGLYLSTGTNAELLVVDSQNRRTGFDPTITSIVTEIPNSTHFFEATDDELGGAPPKTASHMVDIFRPVSDTYRFVITGLNLGTYTVIIRSFSQDGTPQLPLVAQGLAQNGSTSTYQLQFNPLPGSLPKLTRMVTFATTLTDINVALRLGLIDNSGIANSFASMLQEASAAANRQDFTASINILNALKSALTAQTGKHVTGITPQVLLDDVNSLILQSK